MRALRHGMHMALAAWMLSATAFGLDVPTASSRPAAIVASLTKQATVLLPHGGQPRMLELFEWIPAGSILETGSGSSLTLAFQSGVRYVMGEKTRAMVTEVGLTSVVGQVQALAAVPPLPRVPELVKPPTRVGAIRIRGESVKGLYPSERSATLAGGTILQFAPVPGAGKYRVEIEDESGKSVFDAETQSPFVSVSPGVLKSQTRYYWKVRTLDKPGEVARGEGEFMTLSAEAEKGRAALKEALEKAGDAASLALLAAIDRDLGLLSESREEFRAALAKSPGDAGLRQALESVERQLASER
jgi:hypothetical protein